LGGLGVVGVSSSLYPSWMPKLVFSPRFQNNAPAQRDVLVAVFQRGGMDGLNAVVPFGEGAQYYDKRPNIAIREPDGGDLTALNLNDHFGLHPALRPLTDIYDAGGLAVVHGAGSPDPTRSHFDAMEYMERGTPGDRSTSAGWINRHLMSAAWQNESPFRAVGIGAMVQGSLRGQIPALALRSISDFHLQGRDDQLTAIQNTIAGLYGVSAPANMLGAQANEVFDTMALPANREKIDEQLATHNGTLPGDFVFAVGLYTSHYGEANNIPVDRSGNIASVISEPRSAR